MPGAHKSECGERGCPSLGARARGPGQCCAGVDSGADSPVPRAVRLSSAEPARPPPPSALPGSAPAALTRAAGSRRCAGGVSPVTGSPVAVAPPPLFSRPAGACVRASERACVRRMCPRSRLLCCCHWRRAQVAALGRDGTAAARTAQRLSSWRLSAEEAAWKGRNTGPSRGAVAPGRGRRTCASARLRCAHCYPTWRTLVR